MRPKRSSSTSSRSLRGSSFRSISAPTAGRSANADSSGMTSSERVRTIGIHGVLETEGIRVCGLGSAAGGRPISARRAGLVSEEGPEIRADRAVAAQVRVDRFVEDGVSAAVLSEASCDLVRAPNVSSAATFAIEEWTTWNRKRQVGAVTVNTYFAPHASVLS
jgi:hypothetical protein